MTGENDGSVYAELRIALDKLQKDVDKAGQLFNGLGDKVSKTTSQTENQFGAMEKGVGAALGKMSKGAISKVATMAQGMQKAIKSAPIVALILGAIAVVKKAFSGVAAFIRQTSDEFRAFESELARVGTLLQTTGATAWTSTRQIANAARELADATTFSEKQIINLQGTLLRFGNITGEAFERATVTALDMAAALGKDAVSAGNLLGRALSEPIYGLQTLRRQGISFTQEQRELIEQATKTGNTLEAQNIILTALERTYAGVAANMATVFDSQSRLENAAERLRRAQGEATDGLRHWFTNFRAGMVEMRLGWRETRNAINAANNFDNSAAIDRINRMRDALREVVDENERIELQMSIQHAENELQREEMVHSLTRLEQQYRQLTRSMATGMGMYNSHLQEQVEQLRERILLEHESLKIHDEKIKAIQRENAETVRLRTIEEDAVRQVEDINQRRLDIERARINTLEEINRAENMGLITAENASQRRRAAYESEFTALNQLISAAHDLAEANVATQAGVASIVKTIELSMGQAVEHANHLADVPRFVTPMEEVRKTMLRLLTVHAQAVADVRDDQEAVEKLNATFYEQVRRRVVAEGHMWERVGEQIRAVAGYHSALGHYSIGSFINAHKTAEAYREQNEALEEQERIRGLNRNALIDAARQLELITASEIRRLEIMRKQEIERRKAAADWVYLNEKVQRQVIADIEKRYEILIQNIKDAADDAVIDWAKVAAHSFRQLSAMVGAVGQLINTIVRNDTEYRLRLLREEHEERERLERESFERQLEIIRERYQAQLFYTGLTQAATQEQFSQELQNAIATGNHRLVFKAKQAKREFEIREQQRKAEEALEQKYEAKRLEREREYNQKKAELEYRAAITSWRIQIASTTASIAQGIAKALGSAPPPANAVLAGITAGLGAVQLAAVKMARPKLQTFNTGGIVAGNPYRGDIIPIMAKGKEMVLTEQDQKSLFDQIRGGERSEPIIINTVIELDSQVIAEAVFEVGSSGNAFIRARGVTR